MRRIMTAIATLVVLVTNCEANGDEGYCRPYFKLANRQSRIDRTGMPNSLRKSKHSQSTAAAPWVIADLCAAYKIPRNFSGTGVIGILELGGGWVQSDLDRFSSINGLPTIQVTNVSVDGTSNAPSSPPDLTSADVEAALDIQVAASTYYYATGKMPVIKVFYASNDFESFEAVINAAVAEKCDVLSISWGASEYYWQQYAPGAAKSLDAAAETAAAKGLVILAASGDFSSSDGDPGINVDVPAACPHIIGCGGTTKTSTSEVAWGDGVPTDYGTGGGFSTIFPRQAFQLGAPRGGGRMVPDISANADPETGYLMVYGGQQVQVGGTSAVAPFYAGLFAASGRKLGFITPTLWKHPHAFTDITKGSIGAYSAKVGPDACTGLGVPYAGGSFNLFTDVGQVFTVKVQDRVSGNYQATLLLNDPTIGEFSLLGPRTTASGTYRQFPPNAVISTLLGKSPTGASLFPGNFTAIIVDWKASGIPFLFDHVPASIYGWGLGMNSSKKLESYSFAGQN